MRLDRTLSLDFSCEINPVVRSHWRSIVMMGVCVAAASVAAGCGSGDHGSTQSRRASKAVSPLAGRLSTWSSAATSYNATLQGCDQPYPTHGYVAACTREWRGNYKRATARLLRALPAARPSSPCGHALGQVRSLAVQTTASLRRAFEAYSAFLDNRRYHGSRVRGPVAFLLLKRADKATKRDTKLADRLSTTVRQTCPA
jgi:hypothetical protein